MTRKELSVEEQNRILSGNRFGGPQGGSFPPVDPRYVEAIRNRRAMNILAVAFVVSCVLGAALFVSSSFKIRQLRAERDRALLVCERLPIALQGMRTSITRSNPDSLEIAKRAGAASLILNMVLGPCIGDDNAPSFYAQRLSEANDAAAVNAVIDEMIGRLRHEHR